VAGFGGRSDYDATLNDRAIAAAISDVIDRLVVKLKDRPWKTDILDVQGTQVFISGGKSQGLRPGVDLVVMESADREERPDGVRGDAAGEARREPAPRHHLRRHRDERGVRLRDHLGDRRQGRLARLFVAEVQDWSQP